ncbi:hypothetical protein LEP1GSC062_1145 [Leptospira alexanderi serovar Manhao 3 str. L 60]|uniref:Uncharacterized protein n=1 Tax=Leptospira alexanderi serovar Manhao 3 str. L 60 TaxID=1049759 RepID=V6IEL8_9LEPT|nr:hypothetical protein LEP1GSC062_1145 [Leptospira alexanderi serovar Manhao 3 str. L 60]
MCSTPIDENMPFTDPSFAAIRRKLNENKDTPLLFVPILWNEF